MIQMELTQKEQMVLKAMQEGAYASFHPYMGRFNPNEHYSVEGAGKCTREMKKLIKLGFVESKQKSYNSWAIISLTEKGKNFKCELEKPYDVWAVESDFNNFNIKVNKYCGFLKGSVYISEGGNTSKETDSRKFFLKREDAFNHALKLQESKIRSAEGRVAWAKEKLEELKKHEQHPNQDKAGYL